MRNIIAATFALLSIASIALSSAQAGPTGGAPNSPTHDVCAAGCN